MMTDRLFTALGGITLVASVAFAPFNRHEALRSRTTPASPCTQDSTYQRLAFWIGDWDVYDSTGAHYATQRVHMAVDDCAITAEWTGRVGDKGLGVSAFDVQTGEWRQVYISNQVPSRSGIKLRKSDRSYSGPGIRFIPLVDPPADVLERSRVTIMPLDNHRALQLFEDSRDGGTSWQTVFKAEHRLR